MKLETLVTDRRFVGAVVVLVGANLLIGNASTAVWDQDEAAYAGFAKNMLERGEWVVPEFPCAEPHRKVPLAFWLIAGSYAVCGVNEFVLRLPGVLAVVATAASVWFGARFVLGAAVAKLAALILLSCPFVLLMGKLALTDGPLLALETIAALALLRGVVRPSWKATVVLWAAVAAGVLTKGPAILILVGGMFGFLAVFYPRRRNLVHLHPWLGLPAALLPLAIWAYLAWQRDPGYVRFLWEWYVLRRVGGFVYGQAGLPGTHLLFFFLGLMPWSGYLPAALADAWRGIRRRRLALVLLGSWLFGGWVLWELPLSKLPTYTLGAYPALALLLARQVRRNVTGRLAWSTSRALRVGFGALIVVCGAVACAVLGIALWVGTGWSKALALLPTTVIAGMALYAHRCQRRGLTLPSVKTLLLGSLVGNWLVWVVLIPGLEPRRAATRQIARTLAELCTPDTTVVVVKRMSLPSLPFYVQQAGLRFEAIIERPPAGAPVKLSKEEDQRRRLDRTVSLYRSGAPYAFVLDEEQYTALRGEWPDARAIRTEGWLADKFQKTGYVLLIPASALRPDEGRRVNSP